MAHRLIDSCAGVGVAVAIGSQGQFLRCNSWHCEWALELELGHGVVALFHDGV